MLSSFFGVSCLSSPKLEGELWLAPPARDFRMIIARAMSPRTTANAPTPSARPALLLAALAGEGPAADRRYTEFTELVENPPPLWSDAVTLSSKSPAAAVLGIT